VVAVPRILLSVPNNLKSDEDTPIEIPLGVTIDGINDLHYFKLKVVVRDETNSTIVYGGVLGSTLPQLTETPMKLPDNYPIQDMSGDIVVDLILSNYFNEVVESHTVVVQVQPINDAPVITLSDKISVLANGQYHQLDLSGSGAVGNGAAAVPTSAPTYVVFDADGDDTISFTMDVFAPGVLIKADATSDGETSIAIVGAYSGINDAINAITILADTDTPFSVFISVSDGIAPDFFGTLEIIPVCDSKVPAIISSAKFKPHLFGLDIQFETMVYLDTTVPVYCSELFDAISTNAFGKDAICRVTQFVTPESNGLRGFRSLDVIFGTRAHLTPGDTINLHSTTRVRACSGSAGALAATVSLPSTVNPPLLVLSAKSTDLGACDDLIVQGSLQGAGSLPVAYTWNEPTGKLFASLDDTLLTTNATNELVIKAGDWPQVDKEYTIYLTATVKYTGLSTTSTIIIRTSPEMLPQILVPAVPPQIYATCNDISFSLSLPHAACGDPTASMNYNWMLESYGKVVHGPWENVNKSKVIMKISDLGDLSDAYTLRLTATSSEGTTLASRLAIPVAVSCDPRIAILGGSKQTHSFQKPFELKSVLQDFVASPTFVWECGSSIGPCLTADYVPFAVNHTQNVTIPQDVLTMGPRTFVVVANGGIDLRVSASVDVMLLPECLSVEFVVRCSDGNPLTQLASHSQLSAQVRVLDTFDDDATNLPTVVWDLDGIPATTNGMSAFLANSIDDPLLEPGTTKTISVTVSKYIEALGKRIVGEASAQVTVMSKPAGGIVDFAAVDGGKYEVRTSGWNSMSNGGSPIMYDCFFATGHASSVDNIPLSAREYVTIEPTASSTFYIDFIPTGDLTIVVSAQSSYGRSYAIANTTVSEDQAFTDTVEITGKGLFGAINLSDETQKVLAESARSGDINSPSQLFTAVASATARTQLNSRKRRGEVGVFPNQTKIAGVARSPRQNEPGISSAESSEEAMLVEAMTFYMNNAAAFAPATLADKQWKILAAVASLPITSIDTKLKAIQCSLSVMSYILESDDASRTGIDFATGSVMFAIVEALTSVLYLRPHSSIFAGRADWTETLLQLTQLASTQIAAGSHAPQFAGSSLDLSAKQLSRSTEVTLARVELSDTSPFEFYSGTEVAYANTDGVCETVPKCEALFGEIKFNDCCKAPHQCAACSAAVATSRIGSIALCAAPDAVTVEAMVNVAVYDYATSPLPEAMGKASMYGEMLDLVSSVVYVEVQNTENGPGTSSFALEIAVTTQNQEAEMPSAKICHVWNSEASEWITDGVTTLSSPKAGSVRCLLSSARPVRSRRTVGDGQRVAVFEDFRDNPASSSTKTTMTTTTPHGAKQINVNNNPGRLADNGAPLFELNNAVDEDAENMERAEQDAGKGPTGAYAAVGILVGVVLIIGCILKYKRSKKKAAAAAAAAQKAAEEKELADAAAKDLKAETYVPSYDHRPLVADPLKAAWKRPIRPPRNGDPFVQDSGNIGDHENIPSDWRQLVPNAFTAQTRPTTRPIAIPKGGPEQDGDPFVQNSGSAVDHQKNPFQLQDDLRQEATLSPRSTARAKQQANAGLHADNEDHALLEPSGPNPIPSQTRPTLRPIALPKGAPKKESPPERLKTPEDRKKERKKARETRKAKTPAPRPGSGAALGRKSVAQSSDPFQRPKTPKGPHVRPPVGKKRTSPERLPTPPSKKSYDATGVQPARLPTPEDRKKERKKERERRRSKTPAKRLPAPPSKASSDATDVQPPVGKKKKEKSKANRVGPSQEDLFRLQGANKHQTEK
jgi:hypothetical protein